MYIWIKYWFKVAVKMQTAEFFYFTIVHFYVAVSDSFLKLYIHSFWNLSAFIV